MAAIAPRSAGPPLAERAGSPGHSAAFAQLRSERGVGAATVSVDLVSVTVVSVGAVLLSVALGSVVVVVVLLGIVVVSAGCD